MTMTRRRRSSGARAAGSRSDSSDLRDPDGLKACFWPPSQMGSTKDRMMVRAM